ncbi:MAG: FAD:protein FMN transferase [Candidatus Omnitrophota bacterium]
MSKKISPIFPAKTHRLKGRFIFIFLFISICAVSLSRCANTDAVLNRKMILMGTEVRVTVVSSAPDAANYLKEAFSLIKKYDRMFNFYEKDSELSFINRRAMLEPVRVSSDMFEIIDKAIYYAEITHGMFDVTATSLQRKGGYGSIILDKNAGTVYFKEPNAKIDLGGIAAGFCLDKVIEYFEDAGIENFLVDIGGDVYAHGLNAAGRLWRVGIRNPLRHEEIIEPFNLKNRAVTTSGNYIKKHIVNPASESIAVSAEADNILSVTVISDKALDADVFATAFFVMGKDKTQDFLKQMPQMHMRVIFIMNERGKPKLVRL